MTDPTPEMVAMARRIAADTWGLTGPNRQAVINGEWDDIRQVRCAIAAIIETSEMAAKFIAMREATEGRNWQQGSKVLSAFDHIKPENG